MFLLVCLSPSESALTTLTLARSKRTFLISNRSWSTPPSIYNSLILAFLWQCVIYLRISPASQPWGSTGGMNRSLPTGGLAYGSPRKASTGPSPGPSGTRTIPCTRPCRVCTTLLFRAQSQLLESRSSSNKHMLMLIITR